MVIVGASTRRVNRRVALAGEAKALKAGVRDFSFQGAFLADESKSGALKISSREELQSWLESLPPEQGRWVAVAIAARAALRVAPLVAAYDWRASDEARRDRFLKLTFATFVAAATARAAAQYPNRFEELRAYAASGVRGLTALLDPSDQISGDACESAVLAVRAISNAPTSPLYTDSGGFSASSVELATFAANAAARDIETRADAFITFAEASNAAGEAGAAAMWISTSADANFIASGRSAPAITAQPLWPNGAPHWADGYWKRLQDDLRSKDNARRFGRARHGQPYQLSLLGEDDWRVWIDWYDRRLEGVSDPEEIELIFATVPDKEREAGPAAANKWIKERLEELQQKESPPPQIPRQGPGPHVEIDAETGAVVPAKPESLDGEGNNLARLNAHHPRIVQHARELLANLGQNEQPELFAAAKSYFDNINRDLSQIDFERLWGEGVYLEEAEAAAARRIEDAMREPLNDAALAALKALLQIHGPFILATKAGLENLAFANAYKLRPDEAKEQRAAAIELAQKFKANPDVVAPETSADFAHFAEQPESTKHPERSSAYLWGMGRNISLVIVSGAAIRFLKLIAGDDLAAPWSDGLKKSKAYADYLEVSGLVKDGLDKLSEADLLALKERLRKIPFERYRQLVLDNEELLRRLAGSGKQSRWLHEHLDWLKRTSEPPK